MARSARKPGALASRITAKQRVARKKNIAIARAAKPAAKGPQKGKGDKSVKAKTAKLRLSKNEKEFVQGEKRLLKMHNITGKRAEKAIRNAVLHRRKEQKFAKTAEGKARSKMWKKEAEAARSRFSTKRRFNKSGANTNA